MEEELNKEKEKNKVLLNNWGNFTKDDVKKFNNISSRLRSRFIHNHKIRDHG